MDSIRSWIQFGSYRPINIDNEYQNHNNHKNGFKSKSMLSLKGARVFKLKIQAASPFDNKLSRSPWSPREGDMFDADIT